MCLSDVVNIRTTFVAYVLFITNIYTLYVFNRRESSKRNYYIISPKVIIKTIIILFQFLIINISEILQYCDAVYQQK